ncbi:hypothetical protein [Ruegeria sp. HKCCD7559]|uniref:hypothetical protein n=1 Tax=Ruegeria sp. HKCCD7559 TaxID=2683005 RepID=UPI001492E026|nr:hypothetical protein [Ruegeria sp. HKCCD7559]NOC47428.1 hypothetical protein [Ruegeria sp. HKCCD7559]
MRMLILLSGLLIIPTTALAYIGPGAGLGAIGTLVALVGAVLLAIIGFVWYPVKRMMRRRKPVDGVSGDDPKSNT